MGFNLYDIVTQLIGPLPLEYEFIYGVALVFACVGMVFILISPFLLMLKIVGR